MKEDKNHKLEIYNIYISRKCNSLTSLYDITRDIIKKNRRQGNISGVVGG